MSPTHFILPDVSLFGHGQVCMSGLMVNSYGHVGMVSSVHLNPSHTFFLGKLD